MMKNRLERQKETVPRSYNLRPLKTFLLLKDEQSEMKVVDYYIIRECNHRGSVSQIDHDDYDNDG